LLLLKLSLHSPRGLVVAAFHDNSSRIEAEFSLSEFHYSEVSMQRNRWRCLPLEAPILFLGMQ
jgi:hypothetical protein